MFWVLEDALSTVSRYEAMKWGQDCQGVTTHTAKGLFPRNPRYPPASALLLHLSPDCDNGPNPLRAQAVEAASGAGRRPLIVQFVLLLFIPPLLPGASPEREGILSVANKNTVQIILK